MSDPRDDVPVPERPDPPSDWQEESEWSGYTRDERWPTPGEPGRRSAGRIRMPAPREWLGIAAVVIVVLIVVQAAFWLIGQFLP